MHILYIYIYIYVRSCHTHVIHYLGAPARCSGLLPHLHADPPLSLSLSLSLSL